MEQDKFIGYGCGSILLVQCGDNSSANAVLWTSRNGIIHSSEAFIGKNGTGKLSEGDGKTPLGTFGARRAFGILPNPGTCLEYLDVKPGIIACDEEGPYYNQIVDCNARGISCKGEVMNEVVPAYNYGIETDFNPQNEYPLGSAIFIHCKGTRPYTAGCIALDEDFMKLLLLHATPDFKLVIEKIK